MYTSVLLSSEIILTNIGLFESRGIVDTITGDSDDGPRTLTPFHDDQFLLGGSPGEHDLRVVLQNVVYLVLAVVLQLVPVNNTCLCVAATKTGCIKI